MTCKFIDMILDPYQLYNSSVTIADILNFITDNVIQGASLVAQLVKNPPSTQETTVWFLGQEDPLEEGMAIHSGILAWRIPWTVRSTGSQRVRQDWATFAFIFSVIQRVKTVHSFNYVL